MTERKTETFKFTAMEIQRLTPHQGPALMQYKINVLLDILCALFSVFFCYKFLLSVISTLRLEAQNHGKCIFDIPRTALTCSRCYCMSACTCGRCCRVINYSSNFLLLEYSLISISGCKFPFPVQF